MQMINNQEAFSFQNRNPSLNEILEDLENAIESNYHLKNSIEEENELEKDEEEDNFENDEDFILKEIEICENDNDIKELLEIEESKLIFGNETSYKYLYRKAMKKTFHLMKIIKKFISTEKNDKYEVFKKEKEQTLTALSELNKNFTKENKLLKKKLQTNEENLEIFRKELDGLKSELNIYRGEEKYLKNLDFKTILEIESKFRGSLLNISEFKNKVSVFFVLHLNFISKLIFSLERDVERKVEEAKDAKFCLICKSKTINVLFKPCNHACACEECSDKLNECPLDRVLVTGTERIFLS